MVPSKKTWKEKRIEREEKSSGLDEGMGLLEVSTR
jgi:hypothetical protein